jgi:hypothetical protein
VIEEQFALIVNEHGDAERAARLLGLREHSGGEHCGTEHLAGAMQCRPLQML